MIEPCLGPISFSEPSPPPSFGLKASLSVPLMVGDCVCVAWLGDKKPVKDLEAGEGTQPGFGKPTLLRQY